MTSKKEKEPKRRVSPGDVIVISLLVLGFSVLYLSSTRRQSGEVAQANVPERTPIEAQFGKTAALVGAEMYGANDPFDFFHHQWKQQTLRDEVELGQALFRFNRAIRLEWHDLYTRLSHWSYYLYQSAERDRGTPANPHPVNDPEWGSLIEWWNRVGRISAYPAQTWDNLDILFEEFQLLTGKKTLTRADEARIEAIVRQLGEDGLGLRFVENLDRTNGKFDFTAPISDTSSLGAVINLRKMLKILSSVK